MFALWTPEESNRGLQVIAVLMAITLWIFVALLPRIDNDKRKLSVEVKVKNPPNALAYRTDPPVAEVTIEGPKVAINKLSDQDLEVFVDMKGHPATRSIQLPLNVSGPPGVKWELNPTDVMVTQP